MFGPTRSRATWKPRVSASDLAFFKSDPTEWVALGLHGTAPCRYADPTERSSELQPDYLFMEPPCADIEALRAEPADDASDRLSHRIVGGFENSAIQVFWTETDACPPRWIALKTFTGIQVKYVQPGKKPPVVFALADEDAYCYCNESPCKQCSFNCKSGFIVYAFYDDIGLVRHDIERESID